MLNKVIKTRSNSHKSMNVSMQMVSTLPSLNQQSLKTFKLQRSLSKKAQQKYEPHKSHS